MASTQWGPGALLRKLLPGLGRDRTKVQVEVGGPATPHAAPGEHAAKSGPGDPREALKLTPAAEKVLLDAFRQQVKEARLNMENEEEDI